MGQAFSSGKYAKAICDRCGDKIAYQKLKKEWTGLKVCNDCWDPKTALEFPTNFPSDAEALKDPRPDNDVEASAGKSLLEPDGIGNSFQSKAVIVELGIVTVTVV